MNYSRGDSVEIVGPDGDGREALVGRFGVVARRASYGLGVSTYVVEIDEKPDLASADPHAESSQYFPSSSLMPH